IESHCAVDSFSIQDSRYSANDGFRKKILNGSSFDVSDITIGCSAASLLHNSNLIDQVCGVFTASNIISNQYLGLDLVSGNPAALSYANGYAFVNSCAPGDTHVGTDFSLDASDASFCNSIETFRNFTLAEPHRRNTVCTTIFDGQEEYALEQKQIMLANHILHKLGTDLGGNADIIVSRILSSTVERAVFNSFNVLNHQDGSKSLILSLENSELNRLTDRQRNLRESLEDTNIRAQSQLPLGDSAESRSFLHFTAVRDIYQKEVGTDYTTDAFKEDLFVIMPSLESAISEVCEGLSDIQRCKQVFIDILFGPGFYVDAQTGDFEFCYVDWDREDTACCTEEVACVYNGQCYPEGHIGNMDGDGIDEVCIA
ncbi:MAG: hypothetical protein ACMXYK_04955, partial [Candidatus Woesearchaeota archaeon]